MQQLNSRAFDEAQFQQAAFQLDLSVLMMTVAAHLDDDAAIAASGLAQLDGIGQFYARTGGASGLALFDSDYQVRPRRVQRDSLTNCRAAQLRYQG